MNKHERVIEAQEFRVTDDEGRIRARFGLLDEKTDAFGVQICRPDGTVGALIALSQSENDGNIMYFPSISLFDRDGGVRFSVSVDHSDGEDYVGLSLRGSDQKARLTLVVPPGDYGEFSFLDEDGNSRNIKDVI